jgi:hypothetical protein
VINVLFSVVIPSRNRADLARRCVRSVLESGHRDMQVVVLENSDRPELRPGDFNEDPRVTVLPADKPLAMHANWERGLDVVAGDYVAYLSDKDIVLARAFEGLAAALESMPDCDILAYRKPSYLEAERVVHHYIPTGRITEHSTRRFLEHWYAAPRHYHEMPSIYGSLVRRSLIKKALQECPRFFVGNAPDVASAAVLCSYADFWRLWDYQVTVGHYGTWSNGILATKYGLLYDNMQRFLKEYGHDIAAELGLPAVLSTGIVEPLLEAQAKHRRTLGAYFIDWDRFLPALRDELLSLELPDSVKKSEWSRLYALQSIAPRAAVRRCDREWLGYRIRTAVSGRLRPLSGMLRRLGLRGPVTTPSPAGAGQPPDQTAWGDTIRPGSFPAASVAEAIEGLDAINARCEPRPQA